MIRNLIRKLSFLGFLMFLVLFVHFYKTSGKFRQLIIATFAAVIFYFSALSPAHFAGEADAFTQKNQQHQSRPQKRDGIFSRKSNNDGSDGDNGGIPNYPERESVEGTQERVNCIDEHLHRMNQVIDSDTESEEDQCRLESKAGFKELPDGKNFSYSMEQGRGLKNQAKKVWKNPKARQEVLRVLNRFDDETANIQEKPLKGFKNLS